MSGSVAEGGSDGRASNEPSQRLRAAFEPEAFRAAAHRLGDALADYLARAIRSGKDRDMAVLPVRSPDAMLEMVAPIESGGARTPADDLVDLLIDQVVEHSNHLHHPGYVGHQVATVLPAAALAESVSALLNNGMAVFEMGQPQTAMERRVVEWLAGLLGLGGAADGVLTHGGSLGNLTALLAARQAMVDYDVWTEGQRGRYAVLVSDQAHYCIQRAVQVMGWGAGGAVAVPTDERFRMRAEALPEALARAEAQGRRVLAVVASACSTATGSFDPIDAIADFCAAQSLWLHVDGAHGAGLALSEAHRGRLAGVERADSVVWDLHKMTLLPALVTAVLFREGSRGAAAFAQEATYLFEDMDAGRRWFDVGQRTMECTKRGMGAIAYTMLRSCGPELFAESVDRLVALAAAFAEMVDAAADFELAVEPEVNIVCFRILAGDDRSPEGLDAMQLHVRDLVVRGGRFYLVQTRLRGALWLRVTIMNPLTTALGLRELLAALREAASTKPA